MKSVTREFCLFLMHSIRSLLIKQKSFIDIHLDIRMFVFFFDIIILCIFSSISYFFLFYLYSNFESFFCNLSVKRED